MSLTQERIGELCRAAIDEAKASVAEDDRRHPFVGAVLVNSEGIVLLKAHRGEQPKCHAEFRLLEKAREQGIDPRGCTLFVTLEPCIKRGRTKIPCAVRILEAGIAKVYIGTLDPDPNITGRGAMYLTYEGVSIEHFPSDIAAELRETSRQFFDRFRAAHFWDPPAQSLYGATSSSPTTTKPLLASTREGLLYQTLDLMIGSEGPIWIAAGDLSWFRELQIAFLAASLKKREVRVLRSHPSTPTGTGLIDPAAIATRLGASIVALATPGKIRFTLIGPKTDAAASVFVERSHAELLRMPEDERILEILAEWFERGWNSSHPIPGQSFSVHEIDVAHVFSALRTGVVQYKNAKIHLEEVVIESLRPATHALETFKLFRINQFVALRQRYNLPDFARIEGSPWPLIGPPVVERLPDGAMVIIDGTHRVYSARARGAVSIPAIVVENPNFDLPSQPASGWDHVEILAHKLPRERRYKKFNPNLFRPIRAAFESLAV